MKRHERLTALFELISTHETMSVDQLVTSLGVSAATIRRDLDQLAQQQLITRTHGGATTSPTSSDIPLRYKSSARHAREKRRIAVHAASLVSPGEAIALNGGTTTTEVARELALRTDLQSGATTEAVVVVTNAVNIANELAVRPHMRVVLTGGVVRPMSFELIGPLSSHVLDSVAIDALFLGIHALNDEGAFTWDDGEAAVDAHLVARARRVIAVADHTKLGATAFARIAPLSSIDVLVTDDAASAELVARHREAGVRVDLV
ncbi:DeoR/GlpR transcriptional regulator [Schaalia sp. 19OD2882]|uniref:DeoR/GlpR family DNA-binding transcription regulator n=1 Tax=Schaalia sp. 19OD2882 TaxID=2794089 RepID=UPI001C1E9ACC|nr:DeoR/GlpR family DNA-binding transcription regulator [Schaalia sp. 19OD2882]QWW19302.1 DeoR/GlpR transcriptional regulator [Schaalia sp. 19OD2882]